MEFELEELTRENCELVRASIDREDIPLCFVHPVETIMNVTDYGVEHGLAGHTFAVKANGEYVGTILLGETIPWNTDPPQMREEPFYRIMGFVLDKRYRGLGIGGQVLERAIEAVYRDYGPRPIALGCHRRNVSAAAFYRRHGFIKTNYLETEDYYYLRYPEGWPTAPNALDTDDPVGADAHIGPSPVGDDHAPQSGDDRPAPPQAETPDEASE